AWLPLRRGRRRQACPRLRLRGLQLPYHLRELVGRHVGQGREQGVQGVAHRRGEPSRSGGLGIRGVRIEGVEILVPQRLPRALIGSPLSSPRPCRTSGAYAP